jgi:hypothetical protein
LVSTHLAEPDIFLLLAQFLLHARRLSNEVYPASAVQMPALLLGQSHSSVRMRLVADVSVGISDCRHLHVTARLKNPLNVKFIHAIWAKILVNSRLPHGNLDFVALKMAGFEALQRKSQSSPLAI